MYGQSSVKRVLKSQMSRNVGTPRQIRSASTVNVKTKGGCAREIFNSVRKPQVS